MARKADSSPARDAFTLLEMLIVLALLAALAGLSWPSVRGMLAKSQLRAAAKQVRGALATARWKAIEAGVPQRFRYAPGSNWFEIGPLRKAAEEYEPPSGQGQGLVRTQKTSLEFLPRGIWFADPPSLEPEPNRPASPETNDENPDTQTVVFHPNGRSSQARIVLAGERGLSIEITLRGLTGMTKIGPVEQREQQP